MLSPAIATVKNISIIKSTVLCVGYTLVVSFMD